MTQEPTAYSYPYHGISLPPATKSRPVIEEHSDVEMVMEMLRRGYVVSLLPVEKHAAEVAK